ncbi:hypothetical protein BASA81_008436 [Batrachochytrium salamandrivorans]|nr:hypothetical protein BASA81_008436 [Batrachochytrium salamandrivorans]
MIKLPVSLRRGLTSKSSSFKNLTDLWSGRPSDINPVAVITGYVLFLTGIGIGSTYSYLHNHHRDNCD